jgi:[glutamine synthetase] adenylyltransferase / [glutamine synthetase]-adenylyl-L-tyrosine phosphorylase
MNRNNLIHDAAAATPDPGRALNNLERLSGGSPAFLEEHTHEIVPIAGLFSHSQFLADYSIQNPSQLSRALAALSLPFDKGKILSDAHDSYASFRDEDRAPVYKERAMKLLREMKKYYLLIITMKDISSVTTLPESMLELSILAEAITEIALDMSFMLMRRKFGMMRENAFSVIGMGKLGAGELNYSSDIDIITVYRSEKSVSTGVLNPFGIRHHKISSHEYCCMLTETMTNLLQSMTEDGVAYRVDLRLRPNGQKGDLSLSLDSCRSYYEAWGKTWERVALIRARSIAGSQELGTAFLRTIEPFVWKRSLDYNDIEEMKALKKKIDSIFDINDIKRGYGGIREIEFFVHAFQLLYGGERMALRSGTLPAVLNALVQERLLSSEDAELLSDTYTFLRRIEHILQMKDDMQIYTLPAQPGELATLSRKMSFRDTAAFTARLRLKRLKVRDMYNALLGSADAVQDDLLSLKDELPENALLEYLAFKGFKSPAAALTHISALKEQMTIGKTLRERTLLKRTVPLFLELIMKSVQKDTTLSVLVTFLGKIGNHASYIDLLLQRSDTREIIIDTLSTSSYLTRMLLSSENLEGLFEYPDIRMDYRALQERLMNVFARTHDPMSALRDFRLNEELKTGMLFLKGSLDIFGLCHVLSMLADAVLRTIVHYLHKETGFAVAGLGGFGARELNIGSDLDLLFISEGATKNRSASFIRGTSVAKEFIRLLSEYTEKGVAYKVDMRLRPEGSKGILVNDIKGYSRYYLKSAQPWEIQTLLRARPVAGDMHLLAGFQQMRKRTILQRGREISSLHIKDMRKRIVRELSKESAGYDIKVGPGGIKEIEFVVQYLQLKHCADIPDLILHNTVAAIKRLAQYAILDRDTEKYLLTAYTFMRTVDAVLRLNEENVLRKDSERIDIMVRFLGDSSEEKLLHHIRDIRRKILLITERVYGGPHP